MSNTFFTVEPYPLLWPEHVSRSSSWQRQHGNFSVTFGTARSHLLSELGKMGGRNIVISSDQPVRLDGLPLAVKVRVDDPGVAVYFARDGQGHCIACDQYVSVIANLRAIGKTVEALRGIERWGGKQLMDRTMHAFAALPESTSAQGWWQVLQVSPQASRETIEAVYRAQAKRLHPDVEGGDAEAFKRLQEAYAEAMAAVTS